MKLIYCYIRKFRNIVNQELKLSAYHNVSFNDNGLNIQRVECAEIDNIFENENMRNLHIIVGKTGSGKTNLLQLIGALYKNRIADADNSKYFMLYEDNDKYYIEIFNMNIRGFQIPVNKGILLFMRAYPEFKNRCGFFEFKMNDGRIYSIKPADNYSVNTTIFSGYDQDAFTICPFSGEREEQSDDTTKFIQRYASPYQRTSPGFICDFLESYIKSFSVENVKQKACFVIKRDNWGNEFDTSITEKLMDNDYWTYEKRRNAIDIEALAQNKKRLKTKTSPKKRFLHDLMTDYAVYIRTFIAKRRVEEFSLDEDEIYSLDLELERKHKLEVKDLPDFERMSVLERIERLMMWLDYKSGYAYKNGVHWQVYIDIKRIFNYLNALDEKYFTPTEFRIPIIDVKEKPNKRHMEDLFEVIDQYRPDDSGLFSKELLPYRFENISYGEYQYAKVLGGIYQYCNVIPRLNQNEKIIYLLDEPETHMHPEFCRRFINELQRIVENAKNSPQIQIIITTHSPFMLSDVSSKMVTRLDVDKNGYCIINNNSQRNYFGANIYTILADGFFLDYTIGESARLKLQNAFNDIIERPSDRGIFDKYATMIESIGDEEIRRVFLKALEGF